MKRWQTRGEVQDSDEEEISLDVETQRLTHPPKRIKVVKDVEGKDKEDERQATPDAQPDGDANPARSCAETIETTGVAPQSPEHTSADDTTPGGTTRQEEDNEPAWTTRTNAKTYGRLRGVSGFDAGKTRELFPVVTQVEQDAVDATTLETAYDLPSSSILPEDPVAPSEDHVESAQPIEANEPVISSPQAVDPFSRASSPLSELSNPPDSPPEFLRLPDSTLAQSQTGPERTSVASQINGIFRFDDYVLPPALLTQGARRSLRARQEKQLHPYMYDKAQYQQQCRERGIRPVRLLEQTAHETQDASLDPDNAEPTSSATRPSSSSSSLGGFMSSGLPPEDSLRSDAKQSNSYQDEDDLPDINNLLQNRAVAGRLHSRKRQKLLHKPDRAGRDVQRDGQEDVFTVPPSPPPSSRDSAPRTVKARPSFRLPRGLSPMPLPTPQISSDLRPLQGNNASNISEEDTPPRTLRRLARVRSAVTIGSDSSTESEPASEDDQRLLHRERRRMRGVLPASWLNIDRKAHTKPQAASIDHNERASPGPLAVPQKGVARRIHRKSTAALGVDVTDISDEDEQSGTDVSTPTAAQRQVLDLPGHSHSVDVRNDDQNVDNMELDWFDPMLAGTSRAPRGPNNKMKQRNPKIGSSARRLKPDFAEERNGLRHANGAAPVKRTKSLGRTKSKANPSQRKRAPALSILDALRSQEEPRMGQPRFVRLAARQARRSANRGRHSPSNKVIRLATHEDTRQANATLEDWRRGAIAPRDAEVRPQANGHTDRPGNITQLDPRTPRMDAAKQSLHSRTLSVSSGLSFPRAAPNGASDRSTPRSAPSHQGSARQPLSQLQQPVGTVPGRHDGRRNGFKAAAPPTARYRGAQLETQESAYMQESRTAAFQRRMQCLTETIVRRPVTSAVDALPMTRFLQEPNHFPRRQHSTPILPVQEQDAVQSHEQAPVRLPHRPRKRRAQRFDVDTRQYRQPSEPLPDDIPVQDLETVVPDSAPILRGLGPSGTRYATDFDIRHLPTSTYFHESTFIGSGDLAAALAMADRSMEHGSGSLRIYIKGSMHEWTAWSEQVSAAMAAIPPAIADALSTVDPASSTQREDQVSAVASNVEHMLRSTIRYLSNCLYFLDAIDRRACCEVLGQFVQDMVEVTEQTEKWSAGFESLHQRTIQNVLVVARQSQILSNHAVVPVTTRAAFSDRTARISSQLATALIPRRLNDLRSEYEQQRVLSNQEQGIKKDDSVLAGLVILHQCTRSRVDSSTMFWNIVGRALKVSAPNLQSSAEMDAAWYSIFTILPCLEFNASGIILIQTEEDLENGWQLPGQLVERCLELYPATSLVRGSSVNDYVRATFTRCSYLFTRWRWWKCESILSTVYDFFARRSLNLLHHEDGHGSPDFLETLTRLGHNSLDIAADDPSFSIFLKLLAGSLQTWKQLSIYSDKKIGGIAWRIIPNHARIYRKDAEVQQTDLSALRNHFELLCTLYFASPPLHRLRVDMLRNLVDHSTSHREACRISVRAWSRLASFQMSTNEPTETLEPFINWFKDMVQTTIAQYRLARTEAEQQFAEAKASGAIGLGNDVLEKTIASNQRQIAATIVDLLAAFRRALGSASCADAAHFLITGCEPWKAVDSFHPSERRLTAVYNEMLAVFKATIEVQQRLHVVSDSHTQSEDSQDYGDIDILQEFATGQTGNPSEGQSLVSLMHDSFAQLVSDAFGSEVSPDDGFLSRVLDTWVQFAKHVVSNGLRSWSNFTIDYNAGAWNQLRDTVQRRKFTPYVLAMILEMDADAFDPLRTTFLSSWLKSLVERASTLKYQHLLTQGLLNVSQSIDEPILRNLPFSKTLESPRYKVNLQELRQRRLALISSVLSNMLEHYNETMLIQPRMLPELGRVYSDLVQQLMQAMKSNYQELQQSHGGDTADANLRGDYVTFVQEVVAFLQQYTIEGVYTVDRFFLDSSAFPLPADDPTYVVGRLRKHVPKLGEAKTRKQLATFLHNISERAAFDQQQAYLSDQLYKAMTGIAELGNVNAPSLRHVLLTSIIPAYIENAIGDAFTWILATPMIDASARTVADLLYDTDLNSERSVAAATAQIATLLGSVQKALAQLHLNMVALRSPRVLGSIKSMVRLCEASVVFVDYIRRSTGRTIAAPGQLKALQRQANSIEEHLTTPADFFDYIVDDYDDVSPTCRWPDTYDFTARQVQQSVTDDWSLVNERYFIKRGNGSREVFVQVGSYDEERDELLEAVVDFRSVCERQVQRGVRGRRGRRGGDSDFLALADLVI
ncbi:hypothetical protein MBLNU13_g07920t2 [Cladosporium sp. NU13]